MTPYEAFTKRKPNLSKMIKFGTTCYAYVQNPKKLDIRARKAKFVGMDPTSPAYMVYFPDTNQIKRVRTVKFIKTLLPKQIKIHTPWMAWKMKRICS